MVLPPPTRTPSLQPSILVLALFILANYRVAMAPKRGKRFPAIGPDQFGPPFTGETMGPNADVTGTLGPGGKPVWRDASTASRSHSCHSRSQKAVHKRFFGERLVLVYTSQAVEIAGVCKGTLLSSAEEHFLDMEGVRGSIPLPPTSLRARRGQHEFRNRVSNRSSPRKRGPSSSTTFWIPACAGMSGLPAREAGRWL